MSDTRTIPCEVDLEVLRDTAKLLDDMERPQMADHVRAAACHVKALDQRAHSLAVREAKVDARNEGYRYAIAELRGMVRDIFAGKALPAAVDPAGGLDLSGMFQSPPMGGNPHQEIGG